MAVHVETISLQQESIRQTPKLILPHIDKKLYGIDLRLVPVLTCKTDENMEAHFKQVAIKHIYLSRKIITYEIEGINDVKNSLTLGSDFDLHNIIMRIKAQDGE